MSSPCLLWDALRVNWPRLSQFMAWTCFTGNVLSLFSHSLSPSLLYGQLSGCRSSPLSLWPSACGPLAAGQRRERERASAALHSASLWQACAKWFYPPRVSICKAKRMRRAFQKEGQNSQQWQCRRVVCLTVHKGHKDGLFIWCNTDLYVVWTFRWTSPYTQFMHTK